MTKDYYYQSALKNAGTVWVLLIVFSFISTTFGFYDPIQPVRFFFIASDILLAVLCLFAYGITIHSLAKSGKKDPWLRYAFVWNVPVFIALNLIVNGIYHHYFQNSVNPLFFVLWGIWAIVSLVLVLTRSGRIKKEEWKAGHWPILFRFSFDLKQDSQTIQAIQANRGKAALPFGLEEAFEILFLILCGSVSLWLFLVKYGQQADPVGFSLSVSILGALSVGCYLSYLILGLKAKTLRLAGILPNLIRALVFLAYSIAAPLVLTPIDGFNTVQGVLALNSITFFVGLIVPYLFYNLLFPSAFWTILFGKIQPKTEIEN